MNEKGVCKMIPAISVYSPQGHKSQLRTLGQSKPITFGTSRIIGGIADAILPGSGCVVEVIAKNPPPKVREVVEVGQEVVRVGKKVVNVVNAVEVIKTAKDWLL